MAYQFSKRIAELIPYDPIEGEFEVKLDANESFAQLPPAIHQKVMDEISRLPLNRYPDPTAKKAVGAFADFYQISPDCVTAGNGSDELISLLTSCFLDPGDTIVTLSQDFSMYAFYGSLYGLNVEVCEKNPDGTIDVDALIQFCKEKNARALMFSNPCNPTSLGLGRTEVRRLLQSLDCLVILDEAYMDFWDESMMQEISNYESCVILKTCSKAIGLAGIRLGFMVASPKITRTLNAAKSPYNTDMIAQTIAQTVLGEQEYLRTQFADLRAKTAMLYESLLAVDRDYPDVFRAVYKPCTNFVFLTTDYADEIQFKLLEQSVAVRKFRGALRITAGSTEEQARLIKALRAICAALT